MGAKRTATTNGMTVRTQLMLLPLQRLRTGVKYLLIFAMPVERILDSAGHDAMWPRCSTNLPPAHAIAKALVLDGANNRTIVEIAEASIFGPFEKFQMDCRHG